MLRVRPHIARPDNQPTRVFRFPPAIEKTNPVAPPEKVFPSRIRADIRLTFASQTAHAASSTAGASTGSVPYRPRSMSALSASAFSRRTGSASRNSVVGGDGFTLS